MIKDIISEYQSLLMSEASIEVLKKTILLIEKLVSSFVEIDSIIDEIEKEQEFHTKINSPFKDYLQKLGQHKFREYYEQRLMKKEKLKMNEIIYKTIVMFYKFPDFIQECKNTSLLADTYLVLFHNAYFALLPKLTKGWENEKEILLRSFKDFSELFDKIFERPSDKYRILALCADAKNEPTRALKYYKLSLETTNVEEHEFMTVLQTYWNELIENNWFKEALELLVKQYPRTLRENIDEMNELILLTFDLAFGKKKQVKAKTLS